MKQKLRTLLSLPDLQFGDFVLFQEYHQQPHDGTQYHYRVGKPILALIIGLEPADQTVGVVYVPERNIQSFRHGYVQQHEHLEWSDYSHVTAHWKCRPTFRELLAARRQARPQETLPSTAIDWDSLYEKIEPGS